MGRQAPAITQRRIEAATRTVDIGKAPGVILRDDRVPGLSLAVGRVSARWRLDYKIAMPGGKWSAGRRLVVGDLEGMDLAAAREAAQAAKEQIAEGIDPAAAKAARRSHNIEASASQTVRAAVERFKDERSADWTEATRRAFRGDLAVIVDALGDAPMALVERPALVETINGFLSDQRRAGASGVRRAVRIANLLSALWRQAGPGAGSRPGWGWPGIDPQVADRLPVIGRHRVASRRRVFSEAEIRALWPVLRDGVPGVAVGPAPRLVMALSLVTGLRIGALALCRVADLDLDPEPIVGTRDCGPTIRIPAEDGRKATARARREGADLVLPLSPLAVRLLRQALALRTDPGGLYVFEGKPKGEPLSPSTVSRGFGVLARKGAVPADATTHDLRRTMRTMLGEIDHGGGYEDEERLLGHAVGGGVARAYDRGRRLARLRPLADAWAARLEQIVAGRAEDVRRLQPA